MQSNLDAEEGQPLLVLGIRGERRAVDRFLTAVDSGEFNARTQRTGANLIADVRFSGVDEGGGQVGSNVPQPDSRVSNGPGVNPGPRGV